MDIFDFVFGGIFVVYMCSFTVTVGYNNNM